MNNYIHPTALVDPKASLGFRNYIGPYTIIDGFVNLGNDNWIGPHVVIGSPPEHKLARISPEYKLSEKINIGSHNIIHEFCTIQGPIGESTTIGDKNFVMNKVHIAHDCIIGNNVNLSSGVILGGHVTIRDLANIGIGAIIHQAIEIPSFCMVGMGAVVTKNPPPYTTIIGIPARVISVNKIGLEKAGYQLSELQSTSLRRVIIEKDLSFLQYLPQDIQKIIKLYNERPE